MVLEIVRKGGLCLYVRKVSGTPVLVMEGIEVGIYLPQLTYARLQVSSCFAGTRK